MNDNVMISFKFELLQQVVVKELGAHGIITALSCNLSGCQYYVQYFFNGDAKSVYLFDHQLEAIPT